MKNNIKSVLKQTLGSKDYLKGLIDNVTKFELNKNIYYFVVFNNLFH